jgi:Ca2+-binding RTX toxin-like protein
VTIQIDLVASGIAAPTFATSAPGVADKLFITERHSGQVVVLDLNTNQIAPQPFFDVPDAEMSTAGEGGLLGLAFHPDYAANGKAYLNLTNEAGDTEIWEIGPSGTEVILTIDRSAANHVGGWIGFGPDGYLYIASGDSGGAGDPENAAQDVSDLRGKILRIDVDSGAIPAGNPFGNEVFAYGLRNPWRASFDRATGDLYIADVGQGAREEIDFLAAGTGAGTNFGWRMLEGTLPTGYPPLDNPPPDDPSLRAPIHEYGHDQGRTIIGGYVYRGPGSLQGEYFFADFITDHLWTARVVDGAVVEVVLRDPEMVMNGGTFDQIVSFAEDAQGRLYAIGLDGEVFRLTPSGGNVATINGTAGNDTLSGTPGNDTINGLGGNDTLVASGGTDFYDGGAGSDTLDFRATSTGLVVDFSAGTLSGGFSGTFVNMQRVLAGDGADSLIGGVGGQNLSARAGNDTLAGGAGVDTLWGGTGVDYFVFRETGTANADRLSDFASGSDKVVLDASVMSALGAGGNFVAGDARFWSSSSGTAHDADDRVIYETDTRQIWYDADGNGSGARVLIATLQTGGTLVASDIAVEGGGGPAPIVGTEGDDTLVGTDGDDTIDGRGGNDSLVGGEGSDHLIGGDGNDTLDGFVFQGFVNEANIDSLDGGLGDDQFKVDNPGDVLADAGGIDTVFVGEMDWTLGGGFENLLINNADLQDARTGIGNELGNSMLIRFSGRLEGRGGDDTLQAENHGAELLGEEGNDRLIGGDANDTLDGGAGGDTLSAGLDWDTLAGGAGADVFIFDSRGSLDDGSQATGTNDDILDFASAVDEIWLDAEAAFMPELGPSGTLAPNDPRFHAAPGATSGHDADDRLVYDTSTGGLYFDPDGSGAQESKLILEIYAGGSAAPLAPTDITIINGTAPGEVINGTSGADTLSGTAGNDTINGLGGNDLVLAGSTGGADVIDGGAGRDSIEFKERATSAVVVDYANGTITGGSSGTISFASIERVVAGNFDDSLTGNASAQNLTGQIGSDTLAGAGGLDTLWGGVGTDTFVFRDMGTANADRVADFVSGTDKLHLDDAAFTALGAAGAFSAGDARFAAGAGFTSAQDASDRVVYDTSTGRLYYDADGNGAGAAQLIATFTGNPSITATDIVVI